MRIHFLKWIIKNILLIKLLVFAEIFIFLTPATVVSGLEDRYINAQIMTSLKSVQESYQF